MRHSEVIKAKGPCLSALLVNFPEIDAWGTTGIKCKSGWTSKSVPAQHVLLDSGSNCEKQWIQKATL